MVKSGMDVEGMPAFADRSGPVGRAPRGGVAVGEIEKRVAPGKPGIDYYLYVPSSVRTELPILVTVHGISRNALEHVEAFVETAERRGVILVAPYFDKESFSDFQRLGRTGRGARADEALRRILDDVASVASVDAGRFLIYGHSGGGQFAHRYAMAHPNEVARYAISAPGWYTLPDLNEKFPYGMKSVRSLPDVTFVADEFLRIPGCTLVGEQDTERDEALNKARRLDVSQGRNRVERAQSWVANMVTAARWRGFDTPFTLKLLPRSGHDFTDMVRKGHLVEEVGRCLFR